MTSLFAYFTKPGGPYHFPGAAFLAGAILMVFSTALAFRSLHSR
jgi:MFS transporter, DHA1 family, tetracycline resistance protein